ncbi:MAG TPA: hypothetical protein VM889_06085 [Candidatus Thermoplasmatota archaeon]|nr:hypothetical protein [Candidatus Thermoplasmatota archaeon]
MVAGRTPLIAAAVVAFLAATGLLTALIQPSDGEVEVTLDANLGSSSGHALFSGLGPVSIQVSRSSVGFGSVNPGERSAVVEVQVSNVGVLPVEIRVEVGDLVSSATGASIPAERVKVSTRAPAADGSAPALGSLAIQPGASTTLRLWLDTPRGTAQYIPAGDYSGPITIVAKGVDA